MECFSTRAAYVIREIIDLTCASSLKVYSRGRRQSIFNYSKNEEIDLSLRVLPLAMSSRSNSCVVQLNFSPSLVIGRDEALNSTFAAVIPK